MVLIREHFDRVEGERQSRVSSDREARFVRIGATTDALRMDPVWYKLWCDWTDERINRLRPYTWVIYPVLIRHIHASGQEVPWHQDASYQRLLGPRGHRQIVTCFAPLEYEPAKHATVECARGQFPMMEHVTVGDHGACVVDATFADRIHYQLALGDALVFGDLVPHRTVVPPGASLERRSFEFRLVMPADALPDKDYFDIETGAFVRGDGSRSALA
jgi:hypothetical protein